MKEELSRKDFLRLAAGGALAWTLGRFGLGTGDAAEAASPPVLAVAGNQSPDAMVRAAIGGLGGMKKFVKPGSAVVVKPNASWAQKPHQAATTNPKVLSEVVRMCKEAGAKVVKVMDHLIDRPDELTLSTNGLRKAAESAGAIFISAGSRSLYQNIRIPRGKALRSSTVLKEVMKADLFINVPIAKVHNASVLTMGLKNLMGVAFNRDAWHEAPDLHQAIADYATVVRPHLTILDAVRILQTNGPRGPGKTKDTKMIIAGTDPVAIDAYTAQNAFGKAPQSIHHIAFANAAGLGEMDLRKITVKKV
ncbi:MAG: DUF362 domain-containing protein [Armatimonadetes bacterium]|nr:DUF362 domain-containing protein [Armatimonadota bacterium]NIM24905.1 DUF362 domain-containing protein [Armatimonadota bacterium]NIM68798.1 DUF362 domain-containing protein [Armatimonadota bacterium]NIM77048.1 DUF362 domain-containing protein [Armatimonadota bacterium]NIN06227.1 DUF362 domain-containing protein [Armatimonadota bacterium]